MCKDWLRADQLAILEATSLQPRADQPANALLSRWTVFESGIRNELVRARAARLKKDAAPYLVLDNSGVEYKVFAAIAEGTKAAVAESSPLSAEVVLNKLRWTYIEELGVGHFFDLEALQVYYLKLQILERRKQFARELGEERFSTQYSSLSARIARGNTSLNQGSEHGSN